MTKKDYVKIAEILNQYVKTAQNSLTEYQNNIDTLVVNLADWLEGDNDLFDRNKFFKAIYRKEKTECEVK